jgi:hypothetical protein
MEMRFFVEWLIPKLESGEIVSCEKQVKYVLQDKFIRNGKTILPINYLADFTCTYSNGQELVVDTKGFADSACLLKRKMFWNRYPEINYIWITYSACDGGWILYEDLKKARALRKKQKAREKEAKQCLK